MTPVEYLNQVRIRKACDLIKKNGEFHGGDRGKGGVYDDFHL